MTERITFIGFGEAGQTIGRGLLGEGAPAIRAYDILFDDPANGGELKREAETLGVGVARDHIDAVRGADLVRSAKEGHTRRLGAGRVQSRSRSRS